MDYQNSKQKAMALLGLVSSDDFDEFVNQHEQKLFEWKQDVIQKYMVPSLLRNKTKLLGDLINAEQALSITRQVQPDAIDISPLVTTDPLTLLESYEAVISSLKLQLMNSTSFEQLSLVQEELIRTQEAFMTAFTEHFHEYSEALPEEVNSREIIDTGKLIVALKQNSIDNKMAWSIERELSRIKKIRGLV